MPNLVKSICLVILVTLCRPAICQEFVPLNAYKTVIRDTLKHKPVYYRQTVENSDSLFISKTFDRAGNLTNTTSVWLKKEKKDQVPIRSRSVTYSSSGDTLQLTVSDLLEKRETIQHFEKGILFSEVHRENSYFISGWEITAAGDTIPLTYHRFATRLNNQEELNSLIKTNLVYPSKARRKGTEGYLNIVLTIDKDGNLKEMAIGNPEFEPLFETEARRVLKNFNWDFSPQEDRDGTYVEGVLILPIRFRM